jgi:hypothetical protein
LSHADHDPRADAHAALFDIQPDSWPGVSQDVAEGREEIATAYHDPDGGWWFWSDAEDEEPWVPLCIGCLLTRHPDAWRHADLPLDWTAWRTPTGSERGPRPAEWGPWNEESAP